MAVPLALALVGSLLAAAAGSAVALGHSPDGPQASVSIQVHGHRHHHHHPRPVRPRPPATLVSLAVTPAAPSIVAGTDQQFTATGTFSNATTVDLSATVTWASSDPSATISASGLAHGVSAGSSTISATSGAISGGSMVTVTAAPPPPPPPPPPASVTVLGNVQAIFASGDFLLTDGPTTYTVSMSTTTSIVNLLGHIVPSQFIAVGGAVEVTGPLAGSTIQAELVVVQTTIDF
jgi:hypothetical protein